LHHAGSPSLVVSFVPGALLTLRDRQLRAESHRLQPPQDGSAGGVSNHDGSGAFVAMIADDRSSARAACTGVRRGAVRRRSGSGRGRLARRIAPLVPGGSSWSWSPRRSLPEPGRSAAAEDQDAGHPSV
jgi:hypothetical protein